MVLIGVPRPALLASAPEFYGELAQEFAHSLRGRLVKDVLYRQELKSDPIHPNAAGLPAHGGGDRRAAAQERRD